MISPEFPIEKELRLSSLIYSKSIRNFENESKTRPELPGLNDFPYTQSQPGLKSDLLRLSDKISSLETRLKPATILKTEDIQNKGKSSNIQHFEPRSILKNIERDEQELEEMEKSINSKKNRKSADSLSLLLDKLKSALINERQSNIKLKKSNESLRRKLNHREDLQAKTAILQEDMCTLIQSFDRSENIREKQKEMIESLKGEILQFDGDLNTKESYPKINSKSKKTIKMRRQSKKLYYAV